MKGNVHGGKQIGERVVLGVSVSKDTHAKLLKAAKERQLTISDIVRAALREHLTKEQK